MSSFLSHKLDKFVTEMSQVSTKYATKKRGTVSDTPNYTR